MARGPNTNRRTDLQAALKRAKPDDLLTLPDVAILWGVAKQRFVAVRDTMADFPSPMPGQGNSYVYPARAAIQAMLKHEMRHDDAAKAKRAKIDGILGRVRRRGEPDEGGSMTPNELATIARLAAETEQRERDQGLYVRVEEMTKLAGDIYGEISEFMREMSNKLDPHGLLSIDLRTLIDSLAADFLLQIHKRMKDVLTPDAKPGRNRTSSPRARTPRPRR